MHTPETSGGMGPVGGSGLPVSGSNPYSSGNVNGYSLYGSGSPGQPASSSPSTSYGSSSDPLSNYNPSEDQWTQVTQLSPQQQQLYNTNVTNQQTAGNAAAGLADSLGKPIDLNALPGRVNSVPTSNFTNANLSGVDALPSNLDQDRQNVQDALYKSQTQYLDPQFAQADKALDSSLANQGLRAGDEAYNTAESNQGLQEQSAYANARNQAITGATSQQSQQIASALATRQQQIQTAEDQANTANSNAMNLYGENASNASLTDSQRAAALQEQVTGSQLPLQQFLSLYGAGMGQPVNGVGQGSVPGASTPAAPDILGATNAQYQGNINSFNAGQAQDSQTTGTLTSVAALAAMYF